MKRRILVCLVVGVVALIVVLAVVPCILHIVRPESEWIQTNKQQYVQGEEVRISFINLTDGTVMIDYRIAVTRIGVLRVEVEDVYKVLFVGMDFPIVEPGGIYTWTWDQTYMNVRNGPPTGTQVPPGRYIVYWTAFETERHEIWGYTPRAQLGGFRQWFEITGAKD